MRKHAGPRTETPTSKWENPIGILTAIALSAMAVFFILNDAAENRSADARWPVFESGHDRVIERVPFEIVPRWSSRQQSASASHFKNTTVALCDRSTRLAETRFAGVVPAPML